MCLLWIWFNCTNRSHQALKLLSYFHLLSNWFSLTFFKNCLHAKQWKKYRKEQRLKRWRKKKHIQYQKKICKRSFIYDVPQKITNIWPLGPSSPLPSNFGLNTRHSWMSLIGIPSSLGNLDILPENFNNEINMLMHMVFTIHMHDKTDRKPTVFHQANTDIFKRLMYRQCFRMETV